MSCNTQNGRCLKGAGRQAGIPPAQGEALVWRARAGETYSAEERLDCWQQIEAVTGEPGLAEQLEQTFLAASEMQAPKGARRAGIAPTAAIIQEAGQALELYGLMRQLGQEGTLPHLVLAPGGLGAPAQRGYAAVMAALAEENRIALLRQAQPPVRSPTGLEPFGLSAAREPDLPCAVLAAAPDGVRLLTPLPDGESPTGPKRGVAIAYQQGEQFTCKPLSPVFAESAAWSPDGKTVALVTRAAIRLIDTDTGVEQYVEDWDQYEIAWARFSPDGQWLLYGAWLGDWEGQVARTVAVDAAVREGDFGALELCEIYRDEPNDRGPYIRAAEWSPDGSCVAIASGDTIWLEPAQTADYYDVRKFKEPAGIRSAAFTPDGNRLVYGTDRGSVIIRSLSAAGEQSLVKVLAAHRWHVTSVAVSPDGQTLATGRVSENVVRLWCISDGALLTTIQGAGGAGMAFSPDGSRLTMQADPDKRGSYCAYRLERAAVDATATASQPRKAKTGGRGGAPRRVRRAEARRDSP